MIGGRALTDEHRMRIGAARIGMPFQEYRAKRASGLRRCCHCKVWKPATLDEFHERGGAHDGLLNRCKPCDTAIRAVYAACLRAARPPARGSAGAPHGCRMVPATRCGPTPEPIDVLICWGCGHESAS